MPGPTALRLLPAAFLILALARASGASFWVAPDGNDTNPGTKEKPFASVPRAQQAVHPGDTVFLRGGTYRMTEPAATRRNSWMVVLVPLDRSGTAEKPITYCAEPGERPVLDCAAVRPPGQRVSAFRVTASWIRIKGIEVTGVQVTAKGHTQSICFENLGDHNIYEQLSMHDGQAIGLYITRGAQNLVLNCDAYRNHDFTSEGGRGGNTDGFGCHTPERGAGNVFQGCRAWFNSDDGFDCISAGDPVTFRNCWSFYNGYSKDFKRLGDGNGFKAGGYGVEPGRVFPSPVPRHRVEGCLAVRNRASGFYANHHPGGLDFIRNSAFSNSVNFNFLGRNAQGTEDVPGTGHRITRNLSLGSGHEVRDLAPAGNEVSGNTFDPGARKPTNNDFLSLDEAALTAPRKPNGDLPDIPFLRPKPGGPFAATGYTSQ